MYVLSKVTIKVKDQIGESSEVLPHSSRYKSYCRYSVKKLDGIFATNTLFSDIRSISSNILVQIYSHKCGFSYSYPMVWVNGYQVEISLADFVSEFGAPSRLAFDRSIVQVGRNTTFVTSLRIYEVKWHVSQPYRPSNNLEEADILKIEKEVYRPMSKKGTPGRLWDFVVAQVNETHNVTASG